VAGLTSGVDRGIDHAGDPVGAGLPPVAALAGDVPVGTAEGKQRVALVVEAWSGSERPQIMATVASVRGESPRELSSVRGRVTVVTTFVRDRELERSLGSGDDRRTVAGRP
jgi:hypothetical protein